MNNDFKLLRIVAILRVISITFWIIAFSTCKPTASLLKAKALIFLEYWLYQAVIS